MTGAAEHLAAGRLSEAEAACCSALADEPGDVRMLRTLARVRQAQRRPREACELLERAVALDPDRGPLRQELAYALIQLGRLDEATAQARAASRLRPGAVEPLTLLARVHTFTGDEPELAEMQSLAGAQGLSDDQRAQVWFALAKVWEDAGDYDRSFASMEAANALKRQRHRYDVRADVEMMDRIASVFSAELLTSLGAGGSRSDLPVLIVGMPRSGTSLVEQILASHPLVDGVGEVGYLRESVAAATLFDEQHRPFPEAWASVRTADVTALGDAYAARLGHGAPPARRVADKNNWNFHRLGAAAVMIPRARVIHCRRSPLDTCLSCYALDGEVPFGFDLQDLGVYHRGYTRLMEHWNRVLPDDWMLEVDYESLVSDLEPQVRRIIKHCGLPWDDACLDFHRTDRIVDTASFVQVRRPANRRSISRADRFGASLNPLRQALGLDLIAA